MSKVDWSLAPDGATHYFDGDRLYAAHWLKTGFYCVTGFENDGWREDHQPLPLSRCEERPKQPQAWSGPEDGLPPVGTVCEQQTWVNRIWRKVEVVAHFNKFAVCAWEESPGDSQVELAPPYDLRRLNDAIDQRETAIRELMDIAQVDCRVTAARLVDAGFKREVV